MRILKFGGKSLETIEKVQNVCKFIEKTYQKDQNLVIVVSAMGDTTNKLETLAKKLNPKTNLNRELAILFSVGETISASLVCICLEELNVPAKSFSGKDIKLKTFGGYTNAVAASIDKSEITKCMKENVVAVVSGFQGITSDNQISTLFKGGSDTTAVALGVAFNLPVEIYSDFHGVCAGDPRLLPFKKIDKIDYETLINMSASGAKVLSEESAKLAKKFSVNVILACSEDPESQDTTILSDHGEDIVAISNTQKLRQITLTFSDPSKLNFVLKNVLNALNQINFYNFNVNNKKISFCVEEENFKSVLHFLSKKLNLINDNF